MGIVGRVTFDLREGFEDRSWSRFFEMEIDYFERSKSKLFEAPGGFFLDRGHFFSLWQTFQVHDFNGCAFFHGHHKFLINTFLFSPELFF